MIREDGRPITFFEAAARNLLRIFDMMPWLGVPLYSIGLVSVFVSRRDQRIGDMVAGTVVVREREVQAPSFDVVFSTPTSDIALRRSFKAVPFTADLNPLSPTDIEVVEAFLRRRWDLLEAPRQWMAWSRKQGRSMPRIASGTRRSRAVAKAFAAQKATLPATWTATLSRLIVLRPTPGRIPDRQPH